MALLCLAVPSLTQASDNGQVVQCWADDRGQRVCGDRVPPGDARREREIFDRRGVVKRIVPAQKTPEEAAAEERARREAETRATYDRYLLQTFRSPEEIERARDDRLGTLDGRLQLAKKNLADSETALADLRKRGVDPDDPQATPALREQIANFEKAHSENLAAIESIKAERDKIGKQSEYDLARYRELRASGVRPGD